MYIGKSLEIDKHYLDFLTKRRKIEKSRLNCFFPIIFNNLKYEISRMSYPLTFSEIFLGDTNSLMGQSLITRLLSKVKHLDSIATNANHSYFKLD